MNLIKKKHWNDRRVTLICLFCGKNYLKKRYLKNISKYCSRKCKDSNNRCHISVVTHHEEEWESYFNFNLETRRLSLYG